MGLGFLGGMIGGSIANSIGNAVSNANKKPPSNTGSISPVKPSGDGYQVPKVPGSGSSSGSSGGSFGGGYTSTPGTSGSGGTQGSYGNVDYSSAFNSAYESGATADDLQKILNDRWAKSQTPGYESYLGDAFQTQAQKRVDEMRSDQKSKEELAQQQQYFDQMKSDAYAENQAAIAQGKLGLQQQIPKIQQGYDEAARQAYIQYMNAKKDLPQQLAAAGIGGQGAAESTISQQSNNYNNTLSQSELARQEYLRQIDNGIANLEATGNLQYAQNASDINKLAFQAYQDFLNRQQDQSNWQKTYGLNLANTMGFLYGQPTLAYQQYEFNKNESEATRAYDREMQKRASALELWNQYGYATPEIAELFGVSVGAPTSDVKFKQLQQNLNDYLAHR